MPLSVQKLLSRLTLRQLQVFQAVYREQGYSKAANLLGLTQPAVSSQIAHLEDALGLKLFEFVGRKLYCTAAGEMVAESVGIIFEQLRKLQNDIHVLEGQVAGDLRLAAVNSAQYVVPYLLKPFREQYPDVNVAIHVVNRVNAINRLAENRDDFVIMGMVPDERALSSLPFLDNELIPVLPACHPLCEAKAVSPQAFLEQTMLVREPGSGSRLALEQHCQQHRLRLSPAMEIGSNDALKHAVMAGLGVAVLPRLSVLSELQLGTLKTISLEGFPIRRSWCLVYPTAKSPTLVARRFLEYIQSSIPAIVSDFKLMADSNGVVAHKAS
jgi:DNA-binding transcriptional LysR family regulator